jgi:hypothetical protein
MDPLFAVIIAAASVCIALLVIACAVHLDERRYMRRLHQRIDAYREREKARNE